MYKRLTFLDMKKGENSGSCPLPLLKFLESWNVISLKNKPKKKKTAKEQVGLFYILPLLNFKLTLHYRD